MRKFKRTKNLSWLAIFLIAISMMNSVLSGKALDVPTFDEVISNIASAEKKLTNIKIEAELFQEERKSPKDPWERNSVYANCTAWFDGKPQSKVRIDFHREVLKWRQGAAPYAEETYSIGFDGQFGRVVTHKSGPINDASEMKEAEILPEAPLELKSKSCKIATGAAFSLNFLSDDQAIKTSEMFKKYKDIDKSIVISREKYQDSNCVKISLFSGRRSYWFDLDHGYAFRGYQDVKTDKEGNQVVIRSTVVAKLVQAAPDIWFPAEATSFSNGSGSGLRNIFKASKVIANDPSFDEKIFTVPIPPDYIVNNRVSGIRHRGEEVSEKQ